MTDDNTNRTGCIGTYIKVASGHYVDLSKPVPEAIDINTIAAALSKLCRFGGHCPHFYSVAEHCVHAVKLAAESGLGGDALKAVFLHDASEAYVGDVVRPLKAMLPEFAAVESSFESAIESKFGFSFAEHSDAVKRFDLMMLKAEREAMWPDDVTQWHGLDEIENCSPLFKWWHPSEAEFWFTKMVNILKLD